MAHRGAVQGGPVEVIARAVVRTGAGVVLARQRGTQWFFLPGGHVERGETAVAALVRELREELGLVVSAPAATVIGAVEHIYTEDGVHRSEVNLVFSVDAGDCAVASREDHLEFVVIDEVALAQVQVRPAALHEAVRGWLTDQRPFVCAVAAADH